jgi:hypothetical protein
MLGYLVICENTAQVLTHSWHDAPTGGTLAHGGIVGTAFKTRDRAARAIQRTVRYGKANNLPWPEFGKYKIVRLYDEGAS